jgi:SAM-dependent methyltransferase
VIGVDRSTAQLAGARTRLDSTPLANCRFDLGDATRLPYPGESVDAVIASRLLATVDAPLGVIAEAHRVLRPGGRCFIAEPRSSVRAAVPIALMRMAARLDAFRHRRSVSMVGRVAVLDPGAFRAVIRSRPWGSVSAWEDGAYRYAVLEKAGGPPPPAHRAQDGDGQGDRGDRGDRDGQGDRGHRGSGR